MRKQVKQDILQEVNLTLFKSRHETIMKLISTDFSNLGKKTLYDFGDDEAINELLKVPKTAGLKIESFPAVANNNPFFVCETT